MSRRTDTHRSATVEAVRRAAEAGIDVSEVIAAARGPVADECWRALASMAPRIDAVWAEALEGRIDA